MHTGVWKSHRWGSLGESSCSQELALGPGVQEGRAGPGAVGQWGWISSQQEKLNKRAEIRQESTEGLSLREADGTSAAGNGMVGFCVVCFFFTIPACPYRIFANPTHLSE